ncbi:MAG TPA: VWA domain-containing protein [Pseudonocardiaceae bacterium]|nr:VWA domain-containing protein [Pseudonocardiaceae bacterium]
MADNDSGAGAADRRGGFSLAVHENKYLPADGTEVVAVLTVTGERLAGPAGGPAAAEVILLDCSGSMADPLTKLFSAKEATNAAIDALRDGVRFAVVHGTHEARMIYPGHQGLVAADAHSRAAAKAAVGRLTASGGTAISSWLRLAELLLAGHSGAVRHAMLITDGKQEHETRADLNETLTGCAGRFGCDARGIGDEWDPTELRHITTALGGSTRGVARLEEMVADFRELMGAAMRRSVPDVDLLVRTVAMASLREARQVFPTVADLTAQTVRVDADTVRLTTGAWADETREYLLAIGIDTADREPGEDRLAARVQVEVRGADADELDTPPPALIMVHWTNDPVLTARLDARVTHYAGQEELGDAVRAGCDAYHSKDWPAAVAELGRAVRLATESGNTAVLRDLARLVETVDAANGVVRLRGDVSVSELLATEAGSAFTAAYSVAAQPESPAPIAAGPPRECPKEDCGYRSAPDAVVCENCRTPLDAPS